MKSDYVTAERMYQPNSCRMGTGRASITATLRDATVAATYFEADPEHDQPAGWIATPQFVGISSGPYATAEEALQVCRELLIGEGFYADKDHAQRLAEEQAYARRHAYDGLPKDLAGSVSRLREMGVLTPSQTLSEKWWSRGLNKHRAREAMLGSKKDQGLIRRDACCVPMVNP